MSDDGRTVRMEGRGEIDPANLAWNPARKRPVKVEATPMPAPFEVETLEGTMEGDAGDVLIRGVEGELYPCDADIFASTYTIHGEPPACPYDGTLTENVADGDKTRWECPDCGAVVIPGPGSSAGGDDTPPATPYDTLLSVEEGDHVEVRIEDFENTRFPKEENPRTISGEVNRVKENVGHSAGEIQRAVVIGDPRGDGCIVDCGDTAENNLTGGSVHSHTYLKAWRPRPGKDRLLLGRVTAADAGGDA